MHMQHKMFMLCIAFLSIAHKFCFHVESEYRTTFVQHLDFLRMQKLCKIVMLAEKTCLLKPATSINYEFGRGKLFALTSLFSINFVMLEKIDNTQAILSSYSIE